MMIRKIANGVVHDVPKDMEKAFTSDEQLLVLRFEQIVAEPESLLNRCFQHLSVSPQTSEQLRQQGCRVPVFTGPGNSLRPTLKPILQALYQQQIEQLAKYLDMDLSAWLTS